MNRQSLGLIVLVGGAGAAMSGGCSHQADNAGGTPGAGGTLCTPDTCSNGSSGPTGTAVGPQPVFPATVVAAKPPPPISGGTLLVTRDGTAAVAADPDRDSVYVVDLRSNAVRATVALQAGDEPGRLAEDGNGRVHVALRGSGMLATVDVASGSVLTRRSVCPAPRGVAWDSTTDSVLVACATGELVTLPAAGGAATSNVHVERDLRDIVLGNGDLAVTSFRAAEVLHLGPTGAVMRQDTMPSLLQFKPQVLWRAVAGPSGSIVTVHQLESTAAISTTQPNAYGSGGIGGLLPLPGFGEDAGLSVVGDASDLLFVGDDGGAADDAQAPRFTGMGFPSGICGSAITTVAPGGTTSTRVIPGVLPVDVAVSATGAVAVVTPGSSFTTGLDDLVMVTPDGGEFDLSVGENNPPIAVAFDGSGNLVVQTRDPANLVLVPFPAANATGTISTISLSKVTRADTGHDIFHTQAGAQIACASCHPEGGDDGHVWVLDGNERRTPSLRGTLVGTAPYHWPGDEADMPALVNDVYTSRMGGAKLQPDQMVALTGWAQSIPAPPAPSWVDPTAAAQGKVLFERSDTQCSTCHSGAKYTNNATVDVGTGQAFQVPPLVGVGWRTPLLHDGRAATLEDRFTTGSTPQHGNISSLSPADVQNLSAYLETL